MRAQSRSGMKQVVTCLVFLLLFCSMEVHAVSRAISEHSQAVAGHQETLSPGQNNNDGAAAQAQVDPNSDFPDEQEIEQQTLQSETQTDPNNDDEFSEDEPQTPEEMRFRRRFFGKIGKALKKVGGHIKNGIKKGVAFVKKLFGKAKQRLSPLVSKAKAFVKKHKNLFAAGAGIVAGAAVARKVLKDRPPGIQGRVLDPNFFKLDIPDECPQQCNRRGKCLIDFLDLDEEGLVRQYDYKCVCHPMWTGPSCGTAVDQYLQWFESNGTAPFPTCCNVCQSQFKVPTSYDDLPVYQNPYSTTDCDASLSVDSRPEGSRSRPCWRPLQYQPANTADQSNKEHVVQPPPGLGPGAAGQQATQFVEVASEVHQTTTAAKEQDSLSFETQSTISSSEDGERREDSMDPLADVRDSTFDDKPQEETQREAVANARDERFVADGTQQKGFFKRMVNKAKNFVNKVKSHPIVQKIVNKAKAVLNGKHGKTIKTVGAAVAGAAVGAVVAKVAYGGAEALRRRKIQETLKEYAKQREADIWKARAEYPLPTCCVMCDFDFWTQANSKPETPKPSARGVHYLRQIERQKVRERIGAAAMLRELRRREQMHDMQVEAMYAKEHRQTADRDGKPAQSNLRGVRQAMLVEEAAEAHTHDRAQTSKQKEAREPTLLEMKEELRVAEGELSSSDLDLMNLALDKIHRARLRAQDRAEEQQHPPDREPHARDAGRKQSQCCAVCPISALPPLHDMLNKTEDAPLFKSVEEEKAWVKRQKDKEDSDKQGIDSNPYHDLVMGYMRKRFKPGCCQTCPSQFWFRTTTRDLGPFDGREAPLSVEAESDHLEYYNEPGAGAAEADFQTGPAPGTMSG